MSDATVATKPAAPKAAQPPAPLPAMSTARAKKMRDEQLRPLLGDKVREDGFFSIPHEARIAAGRAFEDIFDPGFWSNFAIRMFGFVKGTDKAIEGMRIWLAAEDLSFAAHLVVTAVRKNEQGEANGLYVVCVGPAVDMETGEAAPIDLKTRKAWKGRQPKAD